MQGMNSMDYEKSLPFTGSARAAVEAARAQLMANGFRIDEIRDSSLSATGPGMHNTHQNFIKGTSFIRIDASHGAIELQARLGGIRFMQRFLILFPPALSLFMGLVFLMIPGFPRKAVLMAFAPALPWLILGPLMYRWIKARAVRELDTLAHNLSMLN